MHKVDFSRFLVNKNVMNRFDAVYPPTLGLSSIEGWQMPKILATCNEIDPKVAAAFEDRPMALDIYRCLILPDRRGIFDFVEPSRPLDRYDYVVVRFWPLLPRQAANARRNLAQSDCDMGSLLSELFQESYNAKLQKATLTARPPSVFSKTP